MHSFKGLRALSPRPVLASFAALPAHAAQAVARHHQHGRVRHRAERRTRAAHGHELPASYVNEGFYTGTLFHRVVGNFVVQGGGTPTLRGRTTS